MKTTLGPWLDLYPVKSYFFNLPKISLILHKSEHKFFPKSETIIFAFLFIFFKKLIVRIYLAKNKFSIKKKSQKIKDLSSLDLEMVSFKLLLLFKSEIYLLKILIKFDTGF